MDPDSVKSDAEEILSEFQKTHGIPTTEEDQVEQVDQSMETEAERQPEAEQQPEAQPESHETHNTIFVGTKPIMSYVTATLTQLAALSTVTIVARGKRITQAIDVSQMIVKRMNEVGYEISDVRVSSDSLTSKDGQTRNVSKIEIAIKNTSNN